MVETPPISPIKEPEPLPEGYSLLEAGMITEEGDLFFDDITSTWEPIKHTIGEKVIGDEKIARKGTIWTKPPLIPEKIREGWGHITKNLANSGIKTINIEDRLAANPEYGSW